MSLQTIITLPRRPEFYSKPDPSPKGDSRLRECFRNINCVLLIDDSKSTNLMHGGLLKELAPHAKVNAFTNAEEALSFLEKASTSKPDIIFLDLIMPEKDGFEFMDEFIERYQHLTHKNSPLVVLVSEYLNQANFNLSKGYEMLGLHVDHINKPMTRADLRELVQEHF